MNIRGLLYFSIVGLLGLSIQPDAKAEDFPFGVMYSYFPESVTGSSVDSLRDVLGFNIVGPFKLPSEALSRSRLEFFKNHGMNVVTYMMDSTDPAEVNAFASYMKAHYTMVQAEDEVSEVRFSYHHPDGYTDGDWFVFPKKDSSYTILDNFWYQHEKRYLGVQFEYHPELCMRIFPDSTVQPSDTVAWFNIWIYYPGYTDSTRRHAGVWVTRPIMANEFNGSNPDTISSGLSFQVPDLWIDTIAGTPVVYDTVYIPPQDTTFIEYRTNDGAIMTYEMVATPVCSLAVDWLKISNDDGKGMVEDTTYNATFARYCQQSWIDTTIYFWHLRDDFRYDQLIPMRQIDSIIACYSGKRTMNKFYLGFVRSLYEYMKTAKPKIIALDPYPFRGKAANAGCYSGIETKYTGYSTDWTTYWGVQKALEQIMTKNLDTLRAVGADSIEVYTLLQAQSCKRDNCGTYRERRPSGVEMRCQAAIALAYGVDGIMYWPYEFMISDSTNFNYHYSGFIENVGGQWETTVAWDNIKNYVSPWVKTIGLYMADSNIVWKRTYPYHEGTPPFSPSDWAFIEDIDAFSNSSDPNPDLGWFHVGEFIDTANGDKYIMLVNRACSQGPDNPTEAPSITATVHFNPINLGLGDYVYVIDLADSIYRAGGDTGWVGIPQTTYTAKMPDGAIPFTTTLRAGEGRLFKIAEAPEIELRSGPNTNLVYQGRISVIGDVMVPATKTLRLKGPARLEIWRCDFDQGGWYPGSVEWKVYGKLLAEGNYYNPIVFYPDTVEMCDTLTRNYPMPGDWYGIYVDDGDSCQLSYCTVSYGQYGVDAQDNSGVTVDHSTIEHNKFVGLHCFKGYMDVTNSSINWNELYGVEGYNADVDVVYSNFLGDGLSGIKLVRSATSDMAHVEYDTVISTTSTQQNGYGISISNTDSVSVYKCKVWGYTQSGIYLSNSDASITHNDFSGNYYYGVYDARPLPDCQR